MSLDDRDYMRQPRHEPPVILRPWWKKITLNKVVMIAMTTFTAGSAGIWLLRDLSYFSFDLGPSEGSLIVNVNTASTDQLESLPGIGPALAKRIEAGRPNATVDELEKMRGIRPRTVDSLRPLVRVERDTRKVK